MSDMNRRTFLTIAGLGAIGAVGISGRPWGLQYAGAAPLPTSGAGTTLEATAVPLGTSGYRKLGAGAGWPTIVRTELAEARNGREDRRTALASLVQLTDVHLVDAQSPVRFEYVHPFTGSAFRPQETLTAHGVVALVHRVNALAAGPHTQRPFDAVVSTGDNTDNKEFAELSWFLTALNGGTIVPNTGAPDRYEGVQNSGADLYWNPESPIQDMYKKAGFPEIPGLLGAAIDPVTSPGLRTPWYCVFGNHEDSVEGTVPSGIPPLDAMYTGSLKFEVPGSPEQAKAVDIATKYDPGAIAGVLSAFTTPPRVVTPDPTRAPFTPRQFIAAHLDPANTGPGPVGHGFAPDAGDTGIGYYAFDIAPGVVGISMDSTNHAGFVDGSLGAAQFRWIEDTLLAGSSVYYDSAGALVSQSRSDTWFVLFSHHTSTTMDNLVPDPANPTEPRIPAAQLVSLLHRFPNVLAWVNGHTHENRITPWAGPTPEQSFWEVNTASHIDFPQHGRILEVVDNADGTVSILTTLFEADSPYSVDYTDLSPLGLASLYRELSFNDIHTDPVRLGASVDHNVELLLSSGR
ncbi:MULTISPECIES: TIGR03767 family metallophosphoesterase [Rhodococcus]|uniref:TIGR03767 family metallophosphoesterase n=1 Tax=Rhodococcus oxybenzonivorans TaxID=1990687 RepID=A0AAE4UUQ1_9NOCA|nr:MULTISPECIES: TIGR03767 family metallophosphoesterase [Rhodococcus]MDV7245479.1 TIGR03767 family metallophosphoesterase [Rhodococcus oxybenzonivorans]MDV7263280.1 TIGR03767 family metallophosphoesterase [Rhodococcus oxybenzonivorans]MDV7276559.1 TIGR03767 family metallophosphoesterase [Rhodococcus oxybenzonivorans]MDV7336514.1 TIGR03767 family metallophosphoesterase [Rhodococcus oxybenzonivorans]MDV7346845.1 TIGR03767 family metallophosphoesterase [Rhodococcus oxybenzonivorans]